MAYSTWQQGLVGLSGEEAATWQQALQIIADKSAASNVIYVTKDDVLQDKIDAAADAGANYDNPWYIYPNDISDNRVVRNPHTGYPETSVIDTTKDLIITTNGYPTNGNGTCVQAATPRLKGCQAGTYTVKCTTANGDNPVFKLYDPNNLEIETLTFSGGTIISTVQIALVLTDGTADFAVSDRFSVHVSGMEAIGVNIVGESSIQELPPVFISSVPIALESDDGYAGWANTESGYLLSACDAVGGATGWTDFADSPDSVKMSAINSAWGSGGKVMWRYIDSGAPKSANGIVGKSRTLNVTGDNYGAINVSAAPYSHASMTVFFGNSAPTSLKFGLSEATDMSNPVWVDIPIPPIDQVNRIVVELSSAQKALTNVQSFGISMVHATNTTRLYIDDVRLHIFGSACRFLLSSAAYTPIASQLIPSLTPAGYAASKGIPMTHFVVPQLIGTTNYLTADQIKFLAYQCGNSIQVHSWDHTNPTTEAEYILDTAGAKEFLERLRCTPAGSYPADIGLRVSGYKQSGDNVGAAYIDSLAKTHGSYAQNIRKTFQWAMAYIMQAKPSNRWFATNTYDKSTLAAAVISSGVLMFHDINAAGSGVLPVTHAAFKTLIDALSVKQEASSIVCLTLPAFFGSVWAYKANENLASGGDFANIVTADIDGTAKWKGNWGTLTNATSSIEATPARIVLGNNSSTAQQLVRYKFGDFAPGEPLCLVFNLTGIAESTDTSEVQMWVNYNNASSVNDVYTASFRPLDVAVNYYLPLCPPLWCRVITVRVQRVVGRKGNVTINSVRIRQRA